MPAEDRGEAGEVRALGNDIGHPHHPIEPAAALLKRLLHVAAALLRLLRHVGRYPPPLVVESGHAGHDHPVAIDPRPRISPPPSMPCSPGLSPARPAISLLPHPHT